MDHFTYRDGVLAAEEVPLTRIAETVGTPVYVYSTRTLLRHLKLFSEALAPLPHLVCYSVKANGNLAVLRLLGEAGAGMDVVSLGEYLKARAAGVPGERIVFSGVGKREEELRAAVLGGVRQINAESENELRLLSRIADAAGRRVAVALRVNPDIDARTHAKIATGRAENKFGIPIARALEVAAEAAALPGIDLVGLDMHIGSQLTALQPYERAFDALAGLTQAMREAGHDIRRLDLGGGLGIPYRQSNEAPPLPMDYGRLVKAKLGHLGCEIEIEPGRLIAGNAGVLLARVIYRKRGAGRDFLVLDAAMNDLIRPAMYEAHHDIVPVAEPRGDVNMGPVDVVGPVCETGDTFARERMLPHLADGDLVAFRSAGAYGAVMASEYNARPLVPEVLVDGDQFAVVRARPSYEEMIARDTLPPWMRDEGGQG